MNLDQTRIVITGASRGLGEALATALSAKGARLLLVARHSGTLEPLAQRLGAQALAADVAHPQAAAAIAGTARALLGGVDVLINNAGSLGPVPLQPLADTPEVAFREALEVNLLGPFRLIQAVVGAMA